MEQLQKAELYFNQLPLTKRNSLMKVKFLKDVWREGALSFYLTRGKTTQQIVNEELAEFSGEVRNAALKAISLKLAQEAGDEFFIKVVAEATKVGGFKDLVGTFPPSTSREGGSARRTQERGNPETEVGVREYAQLPLKQRNRIVMKVRVAWEGASQIFDQTRMNHTEQIVNQELANSPHDIKRGMVKLMMQMMSEDEDYLGFFIKVTI